MVLHGMFLACLFRRGILAYIMVFLVVFYVPNAIVENSYNRMRPPTKYMLRSRVNKFAHATLPFCALVDTLSIIVLQQLHEALAAAATENEVNRVNGAGNHTPLDTAKVSEEQTANGSQLEPQTSDGVASTAEATKEDAPIEQQHEDSADDDDAVSQHSCVSTRTLHSGEYLTEDEGTKAQNTGRRDESAKRRRDATLSEERRLARLEKEWKITKKRASLNRTNHGHSPRRILRSTESCVSR
ncbi:hypothetical protein HPB48_003537 [Haemaphysalis longicornis]|uniref:Uncharacterized protein n=1 Tax=Haemaphysalis longicornis TaxID=44386 RepID=A0A9J6GHM0_HAELO|nr:hypothetical protein HPB48_003537 [Haemaphysalis longicornis]